MSTAAEILYGAAPEPAVPTRPAPGASSVAARLYPDHAAALPSVAPGAAAPRAASSAAARLYPDHVPAGAGPGDVSQAPDAKPQASEERTLPEPLTAAQAMYPHQVPTHGRVNFAEPVAAAGEIRLDVPAGWDNSPEAQADRGEFVRALTEAGAGTTTAGEFWLDITKAAERPVTITQEAAMADLRQAWGRNADTHIEAARGLVAKAAQHYPGAIEFLERTGLGNDPGFIRKLAARAARIPRPAA